MSAMKYLIEAEQVITHKFEVEAPNEIRAREIVADRWGASRAQVKRFPQLTGPVKITTIKRAKKAAVKT